MKKPKGRYSPGEEFPELDKLVLWEIQAMVEDASQEASPENDKPTTNARLDRERQKPQRAQSRPRAQMEDVPEWDKAEDLTSSSTSEGMLNQEEQQFVDNTVDWLRGRENQDIIMANIWSRMIGSNPDSFYSPVTEKAQAVPPEIEQNPASEKQNPKADNSNSES